MFQEIFINYPILGSGGDIIKREQLIAFESLKNFHPAIFFRGPLQRPIPPDFNLTGFVL
jgi:hypothetical protein